MHDRNFQPVNVLFYAFDFLQWERSTGFSHANFSGQRPKWPYTASSLNSGSCSQVKIGTHIPLGSLLPGLVSTNGRHVTTSYRRGSDSGCALQQTNLQSKVTLDDTRPEIKVFGYYTKQAVIRVSVRASAVGIDEQRERSSHANGV